MSTVNLRTYTSDDLTKRAKIIDSAILVFARDGTKATVRAIAAEAKVSPGLITHHFGTKEALKSECDDEVMQRYRQLKFQGIANPLLSVNQLFDDMSGVSIMVAYLLRAFLDGGETAQKLMDQLVGQMRDVMEAALEHGTVKPSRNEEARLDFMASALFGSALVNFILDPPSDITKAFDLNANRPEMILAEIEVLTEGVFSDDSVLKAVAEKIGSLQEGAPEGAPEVAPEGAPGNQEDGAPEEGAPEGAPGEGAPVNPEGGAPGGAPEGEQKDPQQNVQEKKEG